MAKSGWSQAEAQNGERYFRYRYAENGKPFFTFTIGNCFLVIGTVGIGILQTCRQKGKKSNSSIFMRKKSSLETLQPDLQLILNKVKALLMQTFEAAKSGFK